MVSKYVAAQVLLAGFSAYAGWQGWKAYSVANGSVLAVSECREAFDRYDQARNSGTIVADQLVSDVFRCEQAYPQVR